MSGYDAIKDGFSPAVISDFLKVGVYPPPYAGDPHDPEVVIMMLASWERFLAPPSLAGSDEAGVIGQMEQFEAKATRIRARIGR